MRRHKLLLPVSPPAQQVDRLELRFVSIVHQCKCSSQIKQVHGQLLCNGVGESGFVTTKILRMLGNISAPMDGYPRTIFERVNYRSPFIWTALIRGYALQGRDSESFYLYGCMRREGTRPLSFTFSTLIKACSTAKNAHLGSQLHCQAFTTGGLRLHICNALIDMYVKSGLLNSAQKVFDGMRERDVISWTTLIVAHAKSGDMGFAESLFSCLPARDMVAWTAMVTGFVQNAKPKEALEHFDRMRDAGVRPDEVTLLGVISACAQLGAPKRARWVREIAEEAGLEPSENVVVGSALIDMHSKCGNVEEARKVFVEMRVRNVYTYSSMILGFAAHGYPSEAMELFREMEEKGVEANGVTFIGLLTACSHSGWVEEGRKLFAGMESRNGVAPTADHYCCMVDLLGRAGKLEEAMELVRSMPVEPHAGVWGALLGACRIHRNPDIAGVAASHLFALEPDCTGNHILLFNVYASTGRWADAVRVRELMNSKRLRKIPSCSWVETNKGEIHRFFAGDLEHERSGEIRVILDDLLCKLQRIGYSPRLDSAVYDMSTDAKKHVLMNHSEKLALGFAMIVTCAGSSITIVKNVRICEDCHLFMCGASQITGRDIVIRDNVRFHRFSAGVCSCGDYW